ncbi:unnamed protein product [Haemonchus placei]|uniref:Peptidase S1 domain-containing protein n=1 Tax=Haemonchus placei TaxID=6290 RepID=A0A0N4X3Z4_HAEPC|nr:unnamed protein product [Haemonchus placei]
MFRNKRRYESVSWNITIGSDCPGCDRHTVTASKVLVPEDFNECTKENDIAIFELREKLSGTWAQPICLPERNEPISYNLHVAARNSGSVLVIFACSGYGGGPLFQLNDNNKFVQVGIASELCVDGKNKEQSFAPYYDIEDDMTDVFTDLRKHLNWICYKIGLCYRQNIFTTTRTFLEMASTIPYDPTERSAPSNGEVQEIVQPNDENLKRASAGGPGGLSCNEMFLVTLAVITVVFGTLDLIFDYKHVALAKTIFSMALAVLTIVAVITKSSILMLVVLIFLTILVVLVTAALVVSVILFFTEGKQLQTGQIVEIIITALSYLCIVFACISACILRGQY